MSCKAGLCSEDLETSQAKEGECCMLPQPPLQAAAGELRTVILNPLHVLSEQPSLQLG